MAMDIDCSRRNKSPRPLSDAERTRLDEFIDSIHYSARYSDNVYEYRHVQLPKAMLKAIPKDYHDTSKGTLKLLWEDEWRALGITQSLGWEHYEVHEPEPHILLFKRPLNYQPPHATNTSATASPVVGFVIACMGGGLRDVVVGRKTPQPELCWIMGGRMRVTGPWRACRRWVSLGR
ncbi:hypothetical protein XA68_15992 [Ophiocordyceps unilateralis]|uniref:Cyclin-dependent kinases regulatory subunit n=1 Tax=Ophiocordyceps unilateralis TaxID=268505 RepID=A0A2A9PKW4_OPHUN|nr:hypothetical protein XA68_15992 [Ophiocordyceps unilateralis]